jgi:hypothetical protein
MIYLLIWPSILKCIICRWYECINHCQQLTRSANKPNINTKSDEQVFYSKWIIHKYGRKKKCNTHQMKSSSRQPISNLSSRCGNERSNKYKISWTTSRSTYGMEDTHWFNPSAWSDERCSHSVNITCRGVTSTAHHAALSHSFDYISTT